MAHRRLRVAEPGADALQLALADEVLGRGAGVLVEQRVERAQAEVRQLGELFQADVLLEVALDELDQPLERRAAADQRVATEVAAGQGEQLAGDDPRVVLLHLRQALLGLRLLADQPQQVDQALDLLQVVARSEAHLLAALAPLVLAAGAVEEVRGQLDDELLAVFRVGQVDRIVRVDQQQLAGREVVLLAAAAPQAVAAQQDLQVVEAFQRRRGDLHPPAVADLAQVQAAERAVVQAGFRLPAAGQTDAMRADVLVDVVRHRIGVGMREHQALLAQQTAIHNSGDSCSCYWL